MELQSTKFTLNKQDWLRGLLMAIGSAVFTGLTTSLSSGKIGANDLKIAGIAGLGAGAMYIGKNFFTNDIKTAQKTIDKAVEKAIKKEELQQLP